MSAVDPPRPASDEPRPASDERMYKRAFWTGSFDARRLAHFRIAVAAVILLDCVERLRDFHAFYTDRGVLPRDRVFGVAGPENWSWLMLTGSGVGVGVVFVIGITALVALVVGHRTRLAAL